MGIQCLATIILLVVLLSSIDANSKDNEFNGKSTTKISTSLKISNPGEPNKTEKDSILQTWNRFNSTELQNRDVAKTISEDRFDEEDEIEQEDTEEDVEEEPLPVAQELRHSRPGMRKYHVYRSPTIRRPPGSSSVNRRNVPPDSNKRPNRRPESKRGPSERECTFFTKTVCLDATDYPLEAITRSLRNNKEMVGALLTDYKIQDYKVDEKLSMPSSLENYESNEIKRLDFSSTSYDNVEEGFTCPSVVKYARPQLARAASGIWKYIINTGEHTQTLRLEKCSTPRSSCSFISENYRSSCRQVYNYHRLLSWDAKIGLHMDIFKVPTCCNCHVHGYSDIFPPHQKDPTPKKPETFPGLDFATTNNDAQKGGSAIQHSNKYPAFPNYFESYTPRPGLEPSLSETHLSSSAKKPFFESSTSSRPPRQRNRSKRPSTRPFQEKLPQQHAPNTRAPGYKGPLTKVTNRPNVRPNRPYRRESNLVHHNESPNFNASTIRYPFDQDIDVTSRLENADFDDEYQEPQKRINYNYHPIIDFFKPEASMLQSGDPKLGSTTQRVDSNAWQPILTPST